MERPNPQPGHHVIPTRSNGHSEKWCACGLEKYSKDNAAIQHIHSMGNFENEYLLSISIRMLNTL